MKPKKDKNNPWDVDDFRYDLWNFIHSLPSSPEQVSKNKRKQLKEQASKHYYELIEATKAKRDYLLDGCDPFYHMLGPMITQEQDYTSLVKGHETIRNLFYEFLDFYTTVLYLRGWTGKLCQFAELENVPITLEFDPEGKFEAAKKGRKVEIEE